jgi:CRISPR-associated protein Csb1
MNTTSENKYKLFDDLLDPKGPVMLVGQQQLKATSIDPEDKKDIIFPPSYAGSEKSSEDDDDSGGSVYNIDPPYDPKDPATHKNVCVLDSIPSQANRMEPLFKEDELASLVPQITIDFKNGVDPISIFDIGHRIADSAFRGTELRAKIVDAFRKYAKRDASEMAKIAPTSLIFGVWDSRGTGVKVPRLINSMIRAFEVVPIRRSAQYSPPINYAREGLIPDGLTVKPTKFGLAPVPAPLKIGGVQVNGAIRRDFSLNLELIRDLRASLPDAKKREIQTTYEAEHPEQAEDDRRKGVETAIKVAQRNADLALQRYILGLALVAFTATQKTTLRQGCQLIPKQDGLKWKHFFADGSEAAWTPDVTMFLELVGSAATDFLGSERIVQQFEFDSALLKTSIEADAKKKEKPTAASDPSAELRAFVEALDPSAKDEFSVAKTKPLAKLQALVAEIEADANATDDLKSLVSRLKPLLIAGKGAAVRREEMLKVFGSTRAGEEQADTTSVPEAAE